MNPKSIFKLFSSKGQAQAMVQQGVSALLIGSVALSLVALIGYGRIVQASGPEPEGQLSVEVLRNIDPADRKFFNPGYGVYTPRNDLTAYHQSEWGRTSPTGLSIEDLHKMDPADRKFFNLGYGLYATP